MILKFSVDEQLDDSGEACPNTLYQRKKLTDHTDVADILPFKKLVTAKKRGLNQSSKGSTLCLQGHHKWKIITSRNFDVKRGKLVTTSECQRCGKKKVETY
jgi:hypothetical protein